MRKTIIDASTGEVSNVIVLSEGADWSPPTGNVIGPDGGEIGQRWNGSEYEWILPQIPEAQNDPQ